MVELETVLTYISLISIPIGVVYHIMTLNNTRKNQKMTLETRQAQLHLHIYDSMISSEFIEKWVTVFMWRWETFEDFLNNYGPEHNPKNWSDFVALGNYLENIGLLVKRGLIDVEYVDDLISGDVIGYWERFGSVVLDIRREMEWPSYNEWVEYLYDEIKPVVEKQHPNIDLSKMITGERYSFQTKPKNNT